MRSEAPSPRAGGFSLIEVMVALAIFGLAAVALIRLQGVGLASAATLADRQLAAVVARNQALEASLSPAIPTAAAGRERAGTRDWAWRRSIAPGPDAATRIVQVDVIGSGGQVIVRDSLLWRRP
ncbi:MAG: type II secretion system minor pseudopilin GspI [Sphingomonadales bacterium]|jgi:general secretion pathway protein I